MSKASRIKLIKRIERQRKSRVITYITSTRTGLEVPMAMDAIPKLYEHLRSIENPESIDLFLHSNGGEGTVPWRLVTLIREYTKKFSVLVPHRAFSAATLTALGADEIVMHPMGMLGPTDPTVANQFNPQDPTNPTQRLGISVEDVTAYVALIKDDVGIQHQDQLVQSFNLLADKVHPLALGNVKRSLSQSRMMARRLLLQHMKNDADDHKINEIVDNFTSKLFYHGHPISRQEARSHLGLQTVHDAPALVEAAMWDLYAEYAAEMQMDQPFDPPMKFLVEFPSLAAGAIAVTQPSINTVAFIESVDRSDRCEMGYELSGQKMPNGQTQVIPIITRRGWTN